MPTPRRRRFAASNEGRFQIKRSARKDAPSTDFAETPPLPSSPESDDLEDDELDPGASTTTTGEANESLPEAFQLLHTRRSRLGLRNRASYRLTVFLSLLCLALGALGGYFWPRPAPATGNDDAQHKKIAPLTLAEQKDLDDAYSARHDGKFTEAKQLFTNLARGRKDWGVLDVEVGRTLLYENNLRTMADVLTGALEKGESPAEANFLLAARQNSLRNYEDAEMYFAKAVTLDPTQPNYYYCWGECLRGQGKLLEAISKLRSALLRNQYETATGLYRLKLWLCEIEAGQETFSGDRKEIDAALARTYPSMEALFASAARSLKAGDEDAAVKQIVRARPYTDQTVFYIIVNDPVFLPVRGRSELTALLPSQAPATDAAAASPSATTSGR